MAELEMVNGGSLAGSVPQELGRWGILRLLPRSLGERVAAGAQIGTWSDPAGPPLPIQLPLDEPLGVTSAQTAPPRAAAIALRLTIHAWRAAARELGALPSGSSHRAYLEAEVDALRATHHRLFLEVSVHDSRSGATEAARR